jgi:HEAT repeat protein
MSTASCPTCGKPLDPLRAPSVKVISGRITAFCSPVCAGRAETNPVVPAKPAPASAPAAPVAPIAAAPTEKVASPPFKVERAATPTPTPTPTPTKAPAGKRRISSNLHEDELVDEPTHPPYDAPYDEPEGDDGDDGDHGDADQPDASADATPAPRRRRGSRRGKVLLLTAALIASGAAIAVLSTVVSPSHPTPASADHAHGPTAPRTDAAPAAPPRPVHADPAQVYAKARATLAELLKSPSDRVRQLAAIALSRVPDKTAADRKAALDYLHKALGQNDSAINRVHDAFALARAGEKEGLDSLATANSGQQPRRDVRSDAATDLLLLGDARGQAFLADMMGYDGFQLTAADALARGGDAKALAFLRTTLKDPKAGKDQHLRALRSLAWAGQADVADELRKTLADKDMRALSAQALARIGDKAAIDPLVDDLDVESLRVDAAIALRRLDEKLAQHQDAAIWADHLKPVLEQGRDTDQASAAEAALILLGPSTLAEHE